MTVPAAAFGLLCSLLFGALFHLVVDGGGRRLLLCLVLSVLGFGAGQWLADSNGWTVIPLGPLQLGAALGGSLLFLILGNWLANVRVQPADRIDKV